MKQILLAAIVILALAFSTPAQRTDKPQAEIRPVKVKVTDLKAKPPQKGWKRFLTAIVWLVFHKGEVVNK